MHKIKCLTLLLVLLFGVFMIVGCDDVADEVEADIDEADDTEEAADEDEAEEAVDYTGTIEIGHEQPVGSHFDEFCHKFKEIVEAETDGNLTVEIYPDAQLGSQREMIEQTQMGTTEMSMPASNMLQVDPIFGVFELPYIFSGREHMEAVLDGPIGEEIGEAALDHGFVLLAYAENGFRHITNNERPIYVPEDLEGLRIRTPENQLRMDMFNAYGASATPIPFPELYSAIQAGTVDGQENPAGHIYDNSLHEVQDYFSISNHVYSPSYIIANKEWFEGLPDEYQEIVRNAAKDAAQHNRDFVAANDEEALKLMEEEGVQINEVDVEAFQEATVEVWEDQDYDMELIERIVEFEY